MPTHSYEASLLYREPFAYKNTNLLAELTILAEAHDMPLEQIATHDARFKLFDFGPLQVLVAITDTPITPAHFLDASRPAATRFGDQEILSRLVSHTFSMTVLVADHPDLNQDDTEERSDLRHHLCWQVTESLRTEGDAALVFWCENDTLYAGEEFEKANLFRSDGAVSPSEEDDLALETGHVLDIKHVIESKAMTFMQTKIIQGAHRPCDIEPPRAILDERDVESEPNWLRRWTQPVSRLINRDRQTTAAASQ